MNTMHKSLCGRMLSCVLGKYLRVNAGSYDSCVYFLKKLANSFHKVYEDCEENLAEMRKVLQKWCQGRAIKSSLGRSREGFPGEVAFVQRHKA